MADTPADRDDLIAQFCAFAAGTDTNEAEQFLVENRWDVPTAVEAWFESREGPAGQDSAEDTPMEGAGSGEAATASGGGRTLGGGPAPTSAIPTTSSISSAPKKSKAKAPTNRKFATLGDLKKEDGHSHDHGHDDDDGDEDYTPGQDFFAGGEKSGLAVQGPGDPKRSVKDILDKARKNVPRPGGEPSGEQSSRFTGSGQTLGGDDSPSVTIPGPETNKKRDGAPVNRTLHFWRDGFSVEDGPLYRFDDPNNIPVLNQIREGRAPLNILEGINPGDAVDVTVNQHEENYVQPKKKYKPFSGGGQRLGSPAPEVGGGRATQESEASASTTAPPQAVQVDSSQPTVSMQIRLADGTRLRSDFNTTHTIGDIYAFVNATSPASTQRPWVLMTTFPSKEMTDQGVVIGDLQEFRRGGVLVQKWT
ncbi:MAG: hypothetical protein M1833_001861 [Piccolia ochrophora]|nr:MAG: hypothetical protein M1833_001861 [Piccolia ochrophora]